MQQASGTALCTLPAEIIIIIIQFSHPTTISKFGQTCKYLNYVSLSNEAETVSSNIVFSQVPHLRNSPLHPSFHLHGNTHFSLAAAVKTYTPFKNWHHLALVCQRNYLIIGRGALYMTPILTDLQTNLQFKDVEMWYASNTRLFQQIRCYHACRRSQFFY